MPADFTARPLHNKTVWLTGASRGIGRATAIELAKAGANVVLGARSIEQTEQVAEAIRANGGAAEAHVLDVASWESCQAFAREAIERHGNPSILVNSAGIGTFRPVDKFLDDEFEQQFRVNVFGTYYMTRLALAGMKQLGDGHIVNVSSLAGENEAPMGTGYFASKHAVNGFTKCLLQDVRGDGIRVTLVCPGSVDTRFHIDSHPGMHERDQTWMVPAAQIARSILHVLTAPAGTDISKIDVRPLAKPKK
ncbi:MAG: hypothetical protein PWP23_2106 [Candidatus Sumerlaeota bacterium]|nr:hypothetical protein [Candidatus Sumerlaeota bacterium]